MRRIGCSVLLLFCVSVAPARSAVFLLNNTSDSSQGDGSCDTSPIEGVTICTLRAAVQEANALPGDDVIQLLDRPHRLDVAGLDANAAAGDLDVEPGTNEWGLRDRSGLFWIHPFAYDSQRLGKGRRDAAGSGRALAWGLSSTRVRKRHKSRSAG